MLFTEESWITLSWQDSSVLAYLRLVSQDHSRQRRTQHHLKAQLHRSSLSSTGTKHPTKTEAFCRRTPLLSQAQSPPPVRISCWLHPASWPHLGRWAYTEAVHDDIYLQLETLCTTGVDKRVRKNALTQAVLWLSNLPSGVYTGTTTLFHKEKQLHSSNPIHLTPPTHAA